MKPKLNESSSAPLTVCARKQQTYQINHPSQCAPSIRFIGVFHGIPHNLLQCTAEALHSLCITKPISRYSAAVLIDYPVSCISISQEGSDLVRPRLGATWTSLDDGLTETCNLVILIRTHHRCRCGHPKLRCFPIFHGFSTPSTHPT